MIMRLLASLPLALTLVAALQGCNKKPPESPHAAPARTSNGQMSATELTARADSAAAAIREATDPARKEKLFFEFEEEWTKQINGLASKYQAEVEELSYTEQSLADPDNADPKKLEEIGARFDEISAKLAVVGATISEAEGTAYVRTDPKWLKARFGDLLPARARAYLEQVIKEANTPSFADAGLGISWPELGARAFFWENFVRDHADFPKLSAAKDELRSHAGVFLTGIDNTPIDGHWPDEKTGRKRIVPEAKAAWETFLRDHPDSRLSPLIREWLEHLKSNADSVDASFKSQMEEKVRAAFR